MDTIFTMEDHLALSSEYLELESLLDPEQSPEIAVDCGIEVPSLSTWYDQISH